MANDEFRDQQQAARDAGLAARHETRVERAIRRQVAEEIAQAIEERRDSFDWSPDRKGGLTTAARLAREIGAKETS